MTMTTPTDERRSITDRIAESMLDHHGDMYGDERERLHWYEGIATAAGVQWLTVPSACAVMVWIGGRPTVVPLVVVLLALYLPLILCTAYVHRRQVTIAPRTWSAKRILWTVAYALPYVVFTVGAMAPFATHARPLRATVVGGIIGAAVAVAWLAVMTIRRRRREATVQPDAE
ncbi:hypothetical protein [Krasilnikovia sp. M28-CT-15]|uniref:hypothetical protein n=1 Tax=Krasilnikovia sp. M28-CT-15 TaxID=3373540 RepID=UPI0038769393